MQSPRGLAAVAVRALRSTSYAGTRVACSTCGGRFRSFAAFKSRENAQCVRCDSLERHRLVWLYLTRERADVLARSPCRVLHVAPEPPLRACLLGLANVQYLSGDLAGESADAMMPLDVTDMHALEDDAFDLILCNHVLEHVPDDAAALREIHRVLAPNGLAILQVPWDGRAVTYEDASLTAPEERLAHFGQEDHVRKYGQDYVHRLQDAGLDARVVDYHELLGDVEAARFGLLRGEPVIEARKLA